MDAISITDVQRLLHQLPKEKLPHAYRLLRELVEQDSASVQEEFMRLPLSERRRLLTQQAAEMVDHYEQTAGERHAWQDGDFQDEY